MLENNEDGLIKQDKTSVIVDVQLEQGLAYFPRLKIRRAMTYFIY